MKYWKMTDGTVEHRTYTLSSAKENLPVCVCVLTESVGVISSPQAKNSRKMTTTA